MAVLYSPIGSPDLYKSTNYYAVNQGVIFKGGQIENAPNSSFGTSDDDNELNIPDYSTEQKAYSYSVSNYNSSSTTTTSSYSVSQQSLTQSTTSGTGSSDGGGTFISNNSRGSKSAGTYSVGMKNGITTISSNLNMDNTTKQGASQGVNDGGTDPGGDPTDPAIPVPDGWGFLLLLAAGYGLKKNFFTQRII